VDTAAGYAYMGDKKFHLWRVNLDDGDTEMLIPNTYERNEALALSPDGATLYAGQRGAGRLLAIDLATRQARPVFPLLQGPSGTALNRAGTQLYVLEGDSGELSIQDVDPASPTFGTLETVATGVVPAGTAIFPAPINLAVNPAETWALVPYDHDLRRVDLLSGAVSTVVSGAFDGASGVALDGSGTVAYVSDWSDVSAVDTTTWAVTPVASTLGLPHLHTIALSPDGAFIYGVRHVYDDYDQPRMSRVRLSDGQMTHLVTDVTMPLGLALTPDGRQAIVPDYARGGRLLSVALDSGATTLLADLGWEPGSATVGPDGTLYLTRPNWLYDEFVWEGIVYGFRPGAWWRLEVKSSPALYQPTGQAISADGKWLVLLANNGLHRVNLAAGAGHGQVTPIADDVLWYPHDVALTSGGAAWVVSGGELHEISLADGTLLAVVPYGAVLGTGPQYGLALSPDGALAYLSTSDNRLVQVNLNTGAVDVIATGLAAPYGVALNGAGDTLYVAEADGGRLSAVNVGTGQAVTVAAGLERPVDVALDEPSGIAIVLENRFPDYHVTRVNLASGAATRLFGGNYGWVSGLVLTSDRSRAYFTNSFNGEVWGVDLATGQVADSLIEALSRPHGFALTGGGEGAYTTEEFVPRIRHVNLVTGGVRTAVYLPGPASGLALTHDEATAYVTRMYYDDLLKVDLATGTWTTVTAGCMHGRVVLDPAEMTAYASCPSGNAVWAVTLSTGARTQLMGDLPAPYALDVNRSGTRLYVTAGSVGEMGDFQLWAVDLPGGAKHLVATLEQAQDAPGDITLSPDERYVYVYDQLGSNVGAGVWRVDVDPASPTYGQVVSLARWIGELQHGEFTADGEHLVLSHANAHRMISLYLDKYHCVYLPAILRSN
jgi:DNA-binding beta-propeller fold protein YncE